MSLFDGCSTVHHMIDSNRWLCVLDSYQDLQQNTNENREDVEFNIPPNLHFSSYEKIFSKFQCCFWALSRQRQLSPATELTLTKRQHSTHDRSTRYQLSHGTDRVIGPTDQRLLWITLKYKNGCEIANFQCEIVPKNVKTF
jgi:hypothetical protein